MPALSRHFRLTPERLAKLDELAKAWGPVKPLTRTDVINILIDKATVAMPARHDENK